ncbi:adenosine receptor A2b-like [Oculina patagonica]
MANVTDEGLTYEEILAVTCTSLPYAKYYIYLLTAINILLAITASLGNALILAALQRKSSLYPPTKLMFKCLAVTDFCVGVFVQPLFVTQLISTANEHRQLCYNVVSIIEIGGGSFFGVALLTLIAISVDRLLALSLGLRYRQTVTLKRI